MIFVTHVNSSESSSVRDLLKEVVHSDAMVVHSVPAALIFNLHVYCCIFTQGARYVSSAFPSNSKQTTSRSVKIAINYKYRCSHDKSRFKYYIIRITPKYMSLIH